MAVVNIRRDVEDKFYRYRMPLLQIKIEGKGNGIKTVIPNMADIARALSRPPACELCSITTLTRHILGYTRLTLLPNRPDQVLWLRAGCADQVR